MIERDATRRTASALGAASAEGAREPRREDRRRG